VNPAWVVAAIAAGGVVATGTIAWVQAGRVEGLENRLRYVESRIAVLDALAAQRDREVGHDGNKG